MSYRLTADLILIFHLAFILYALVGGLLVIHHPWFIYLHLPAAVWVVYVEILDKPCPLTALEDGLRQKAGEASMSGGFVEHYLLSVIYPGEATPAIHYWLGLFVIALNVAIYGWVYYRYFH